MRGLIGALDIGKAAEHTALMRCVKTVLVIFRRCLITGVIALLTLPVMASAGVIGYFEDASGIRGIVLGQESGFGPIEIVFAPPTAKLRLPLDQSRWSLRGGEVHIAKAYPKELPGTGYIEIAVDLGNYYIPTFGSSFLGMSPAVIFFRPHNESIREILLPFAGGEIKGFKVHGNDLDLLMFVRKISQKKSKDGRQLYGIAHSGHNAMLSIGPGGLISKTHFKSVDPDIFWIANGKFYGVDEQTLDLHERVRK